MFKLRRRIMNATQRAAFDRMLRGDPRFFEMERLKSNLHSYMEGLSRTEVGRRRIELIEKVLEAIQQGKVRSKQQIDLLLQNELGVEIKFDKLFPADAGRSVEGYLSEFYHARRGPLR